MPTVFNENKTVSKLCKENKKEKDKDLNDCLHKNYSISLFHKVQEERDFYHNECHRLKNQLDCYPVRPDGVSQKGTYLPTYLSIYLSLSYT